MALGIARWLHRPLIELSPFLLFYAAVAVSSWFGGFGPGLVAIGIGGAAVDYYLFDPPQSFILKHAGDVEQLSLFVFVGIVIASVNAQLLATKRFSQDRAAEARRSESRARRLSDANLIGVFFSDLHGNVRRGNDEFLRLAGCTQEDLERGVVSWRGLTAPEYTSLDENAIEELRENRVCTPYEKEHLLADGRRISLQVGCAMLDDPADELVGFMLDHTEQKRVESALREHRGRLATLTSELMVAEERERQRIAGVLHDSIGQTLALAKLQLSALSRTDIAKASQDRLCEIDGLIEQVIGRTRSLTSEISPPVLYELGLEAAVRWLADRFQAEYEIQIEVIDDRQPKPIQDVLRRVLFEAVRELLTNVIKHSAARHCRVSMCRIEDRIKIVVHDDGTMSTAASPLQPGFGLTNVRERLAHFGGCVEICMDAKEGTSAILRAPLSLDAATPQGISR